MHLMGKKSQRNENKDVTWNFWLKSVKKPNRLRVVEMEAR